MKKIVSSKKWLITYLIILLFLICFDVAGIALIVRAINESNNVLLSVGIVTLVYMFPITVLILFLLNRKACVIWVEDGCLKRKGLFLGFRETIHSQEKYSVGLTYDNKTFFVIANDKPHVARIIEFDNNNTNMKFLKYFHKGDITVPNKLRL